MNQNTKVRSSPWKGSIKKTVLKNFEKFKRKDLRRSILFNRVAGLLLTERLQHRYFPETFAKFLRTPLLAT